MVEINAAISPRGIQIKHEYEDASSNPNSVSHNTIKPYCDKDHTSDKTIYLWSTANRHMLCLSYQNKPLLDVASTWVEIGFSHLGASRTPKFGHQGALNII